MFGLKRKNNPEQLEEQIKKNKDKIKEIEEENKKMAKLVLGEKGLQLAETPKVEQKPVEKVVPQQEEQENPFDEVVDNRTQQTQQQQLQMMRQQIEQEMLAKMQMQQMRQPQMPQMPEMPQVQMPRMPITKQPDVEVNITMFDENVLKVPVAQNELESFIAQLTERMNEQGVFQAGTLFINCRNILYFQI